MVETLHFITAVSDHGSKVLGAMIQRNQSLRSLTVEIAKCRKVGRIGRLSS